MDNDLPLFSASGVTKIESGLTASLLPLND
jgi:hypothetical protein